MEKILDFLLNAVIFLVIAFYYIVATLFIGILFIVDSVNEWFKKEFKL